MSKEVQGPAVARDDDAPVCPRCEYLLTGLVSRTCPECGVRLADDLSVYRASRRPTPWSAERPLNLWRGIPWVVRHPVRTLGYGANPDQVSWRRAWAFAALVSALIVASWPVLRETGLSIVYLCRARAFFDWSYFWGEDHLGLLLKPRFWYRLGHWEAYSLLRWWLLFGGLASAWWIGARLRGRAGGAEYVRRLPLFAPWLALMDLAFLVGVWVTEPNVVPEPSTIFVSDWTWTRWMWADWLTRGALPVFVVSILFFRAVLRERWSVTIIGAALLVPVGLCGSVAWSYAFTWLTSGG